MKKVLVTMSALAIALSVSSASFADTVLLPAGNCCGCAAPAFSYYQIAPRCQQRSFSYYMPINKCCPAAPVSRCCGCAAPVAPCGCETKSACKCHMKKKHIKHKKCNCNLK